MTGHVTVRRGSTAPGTALWADRGWPILAGSVTALGLIGTGRVYGLLGLVLVVVGLWPFVAVMLYGVLSESGLSLGRAARIGLVATVVVLDLIGLLLLFPLAGWLIAAAVAATSPLVTGWTSRVVRRLRDRHARGEDGRRPEPAVRADQELVDRTFRQIVTELGDDPS